MIHQYINNDCHIVLDVNNGSVHVVDPVIYNAVQLVSRRLPEMETPATLSSEVKEEVRVCPEDRYSQEDIKEVLEEIRQPIDTGQLLTKDIYRDLVADFKKRKTVVKALYLHIAYDCNLACHCCFTEGSKYHGHRAFMSYEVGRKALDSLTASSGNQEHLKIDFFGGESLTNWNMIKRLMKYGRSQGEACHKKFHSTLTTNGVPLSDEVVELYNRKMSNVVLSLDRRKDVSDKVRPFHNGSGSYGLIVPKFRRSANSKKQRNYYIRSTFIGNNLDFAGDVLHYVNLRLKQMPMEPVVADPSEDYTIREEGIPVILKEYDHPALEHIGRKKEGRGFSLFHSILNSKIEPYVTKHMAGRGSGTEYPTVTPRGDLYPCHQFMGNEKFPLGNVDTGVVDADTRGEFKTYNVYAKPRRKDCFARFYCSGGCTTNAHNFSGPIDEAYDISCEVQKRRIECTIMIKAALVDDEG